ncbi:MAG: D-alanine--D-alanine ligase [Planctomycetes bacterium]|nr:D-alanine--D-alanine ligase [Planctomycetota bacterium]
MHIGFTYDLKDDYLKDGLDPVDAAEFDKPETIDGIAAALTSLGHTVDRIGRLDDLVQRLAAGGRWDLLFNIAEGLRGAARESQVPALAEAYGIPAVFGDSLCLAVCLHKAHAKSVVAAAGVPTPAFAVIRDADRDCPAVELRYPLFAKPVAEGTGKGISAAGKVTTLEALRAVSRDLLQRFRQPVLVEEYLPGREFTVGIVGTGAAARVLGVMAVELLANAEPEIYSYENKDNYEDRVRYRLADPGPVAEAAAELSLRAYRALDCRDAGRVDVRCDAHGQPQFMEINPLAGLNPEHSDLPILCRLLDIPYQRLIADIVESARLRIRHDG